MAKKNDIPTVRMTHLNGATVIVPKDRTDAMLATGLFASSTSKASAAKKPTDDD